MKLKHNKAAAWVLSLVLIVAMALSMTACGTPDDQTGADQQQEQPAAVNFTVEVTDKDGNTETFAYTTDKATVGEALLAEGLIQGEDSQYGLYITEVNGITANYNVDGTFWAFYINGELAATGVDGAEVEEGAVYGFRVEQ